MFLQRKFGEQPEDIVRAEFGRNRAADVVDVAADIGANIELLLRTRRGIGHIFPDFGFSYSGQTSAEGILAHFILELRENLGHYEPRLTIVDIDGDVDDDGRPEITILAEVHGERALVRFEVDPLGRKVRIARDPG